MIRVFMFCEKTKVRQMRLQHDKDIKKYLDYVSRTALPGVKEGNVVYLNSLQRIFTIREAKLYHMEVTDSFSKLLEGKNVKSLCQLDERCRGYSQYVWNWQERIDWKTERLKRAEMPYLSDRQYRAALCVGSFHSDGYCRQNCVDELKVYESSLPFLMLRLNDWVSAVRGSAYESVMYRISVCEIEELFSALPMLDKVKNSGRREKSQVETAEQAIRQQMQVKFTDCRLWEISGYEISVKNAIYRLISQNPILELPQLEQLVARERSSFGKQLLVRAILTQFSATAEKLQRYMSDKSSVIRYLAMEYYYEQCKDAWDGLEEMLLDKAGKIRDYAAYVLKRHKGFDVLGFYKAQLGKGKERVVLLGVGESGTSEELRLLVPYLESTDAHLRKTALIAYGMLARDNGADVYLRFLQESDPILYVQAYRLIVKYDVRYGAENIYELYETYKGKPAADYLIRLLTREPSWKRLPYLLMLCDDAALSENMKGHILYGIKHRSMYGSVTRQEAEDVRKLLDEKKNCLPTSIIEGILWDLKFVTR